MSPHIGTTIGGDLITITLAHGGAAQVVRASIDDLYELAFTVLSDTQLTFNLPPDLATGDHVVAVEGGEAGSDTAVFTIEMIAGVYSITPDTGPGGTAVTITGFGFDRIDGFSSDGMSANLENLVIVSPAEATATMPAGIWTDPDGNENWVGPWVDGYGKVGDGDSAAVVFYGLP